MQYSNFIIYIDSPRAQTLWILISWIYQKLVDRSLHCFQKRVYRILKKEMHTVNKVC